MAVTAVEDLTGKQIGKYRLVSRIAQGGAGMVYKVRTASLKFPLALKLLHSELATKKKHVVEMEKEYALCKGLRNKRLLKYFDGGSYEGRPYLVMEYFESETIAKIIKDEQRVRQFRARAHDIVQHMAEAVVYIHLQGIIHRDIKADNFLYNEEKNDIKLIDFSTAVNAHRGIVSLLDFRKPAIVGTPSYMAPEQIKRHRPAISADIYSFGAMLFEIFAGRPPFTGKNQNEVMTKVLKSPPPKLSKYNTQVSPAFETLVRNMLAKNPDQRPHSMEHFLSSFTRTPVFKG